MKTGTVSAIAAGLVVLAATAADRPARTSIDNDDIVVPDSGKGMLLRVWPDEVTGTIKPLNGSNSGPNALRPSDSRDPGGYRPTGRFDDFRDLEVPMIRTHDSRFTVGAPNRVNDIALIFPNFDADENDPGNYDFAATDDYLASARLAGCEIMYFLGSSSDSEMGGRPCGTDAVPKDFGKWARICEHVVRHYNEGWGWRNPDTPYSNQFNIVWWEIGNEPDLDCSDSYWKDGRPTWLERHRYWGGSPEQFFELYRTTAVHLKRTFPGLRVGGPGLAARHGWAKHFLDYCREHGAPLDFFTWHAYCRRPESFVIMAGEYREMLDQRGFGSAKSMLGEWNWNIGWGGDDWKESIRVRGEMNNFRMASFYAATMCLLQRAQVDVLMYYDMRSSCYYNGVFDAGSSTALKGYYAFYAWAKLRRLGQDVKNALTGPQKDVYAVSAKGSDDSLGILLVRHSRDIDAIGTVPVKVFVPGRDLREARLHVTDEVDRYTEKCLHVAADGTVTVRLRPNAFAYLELPR